MATASKIKLDPSFRPAFAVKDLKQEAADKASELLQENHEKHHIFFNQEGFHNHIAHHLLTLYAMGATPAQLEKQYDLNAAYQRDPVKLEERIVLDMHDPEKFKKYLGDENYYHDFLVYFQEEIAAKGWEAVLDEYVFCGDKRADDMLVRMFGGFLHPIIHLGFGVEFGQPAVMAEGLAMAAVHTNWMGKLLLGAERLAAPKKAGQGTSKSLVQLLETARKNEKLVKSPREKDGNKLRDGVIGRALEEMVELAAEYVVGEEELQEKMAEMVDFNAYFTITAQHPPKAIKMDFFYMHCINASIFFPAFLSPSSPLSNSQKTRLLEWKSRNDLAMYISRGSPPLLLEELTEYAPKEAGQGWEGVFDRTRNHDDDGHVAKLVRALAHGEQLCAPYFPGADAKGWKLRPDYWITAAHMVIDSVEGDDGSADWVRSCGFESAWEKIGDREGAQKTAFDGDRKAVVMGYEDHLSELGEVKAKA